MARGTIGSVGDLLEHGTFERLMKKHFGTKQCTLAPVRKKQRSDPEILSNGLPSFMTDDYIAEMKLWKKKEIFAKLEAEDIHSFKEGWNRSQLVDHLVKTLRGRNASTMNGVEKDASRPVPPPCSFQTAPPPKLRVNVNVARAVARREQIKPSQLTASKSSRKLKAQIAASKPTKVMKVSKATVEQSAEQMMQDSVMDDVGENVEPSSQINDTQELLLEYEANAAVAESEKAKQPEPLVTSPKRPTSPSIQPGHVSSAKKSYMQHLQKSHASPVKFPLFNPTPKLKSQAQKVEESPTLVLPIEPVQKKIETSLAVKKEPEDIHFQPTLGSTSNTAKSDIVPDSVVSAAPVKSMGHRPPYKSKKKALAAQMRAQNIETLPAVSAAQPSSVLHHGMYENVSSKHTKIKPARAGKPLTGSRFAKTMSLKKNKMSLKSLEKPPLPSSFESYELTDTEAPDYDSEDSVGLKEQRAIKSIPNWARSKRLNPALNIQQSCTINADSLFGRVTTCNLNSIFNRDSPRLQHRRRGSGDWSPIAPMKVSSSQLRHHAAAGAC